MKKTKFISFTLIFVIMFGLLAFLPDINFIANAAANEEIVAVTGLSLNKDSTTIRIGTSEMLWATVSPYNATYRNLSWSSNAPAIATVSQNGIVTGHSAGAAVITVEIPEPYAMATCIVYVEQFEDVTSITSLSISPGLLALFVGESADMTPTVTPSNTTNQNILWSSNAPTIASVNNNGRVTAVSAGSAIITATIGTGLQMRTATATVTVGLTPGYTTEDYYEEPDEIVEYYPSTPTPPPPITMPETQPPTTVPPATDPPPVPTEMLTEPTTTAYIEPTTTETPPVTEEPFPEDDNPPSEELKLPQTGVRKIIPILAIVGMAFGFIIIIFNELLNIMKKRAVGAKKIATYIGVISILSSASVYGIDFYDDYKVHANTVKTAQLLLEQIEANEMQTEKNNSENYNLEIKNLIEIDEELYLGILSIPKLELELPVNNDISDLKLNATPCRYSGDFSSRLIIAAHDYKFHFGDISTLSRGDRLFITDANGDRHIYAVDITETLKETDVKAMLDTVYDLTLFTCTPDGASRLTVRCVKIN